MMEKYGADVQTYEVVQSIPGTPDDFKVVGSNLSLDEAKKVAATYKNSIVRPGK